MKAVIHFTCLLSLAACTTPDVTPALVKVRTKFTSFSSDIGTQIARQAEAEHAREEQRAISADGAVIGFIGDCDTTVARVEASVLSDCSLVEYFDPRDDAGSGSEISDFLTIMDGYLTSLEALASSETVSQTKVQADAIVAAFGMPDAARPAAFERLGETLRSRQNLISTSAGFLVDQVRVSALRRAMSDADKVLEDGVPVVAAHLEAFDADLISAQERLTAARQTLLDAEGQGDVERYAAAVSGARAAHAAFIQAEANSPIIKLYQFRQSHARLLAITQPGADASEFVEYLEELRGLYDAVNEEN